MWSDEYKELDGVKVVGLYEPFKTGTESITFMCDGNKSFKLTCDGDCCSHSWFENMELPEFPFTITSAKEIEGKDLSNNSETDFSYNEGTLKTYGFVMTTDKGHVDIDMRNESNGYYGGSFYLNTEELT